MLSDFCSLLGKKSNLNGKSKIFCHNWGILFFGNLSILRRKIDGMVLSESIESNYNPIHAHN